MILVIGSLATAFFPIIARQQDRSTLALGLLSTVAAATAIAAGLVLFAPAIVPRVYGPGFAPSSQLLAATGALVITASVANFLLWAARAMGQGWPIVIGMLTAIVLESCMGTLEHRSATILALEPAAALALSSLITTLLATSLGYRLFASARRVLGGRMLGMAARSFARGRPSAHDET
jgi:O-antigen/teichoic acid export membrane protein